MTGTKQPQGRVENSRPVGTQVDKADTRPRTGSCYKCGQAEHFATDPQCPLYGREKHLRVGRIVDGEEDEDGPASENVRETVREDDGDGGYPQSDYKGLEYESADDEQEVDAVEMNVMRIEATEMVWEPSWAEATKEIVQSFHMDVKPQTRSIQTTWIYDPRVQRILEDKWEQPQRDAYYQQPLCVQVMINGQATYMLFDWGRRTMDSISPTFAYIVMAARIQLDKQVGLQLGARGSHTKISYGAKARMAVVQVDDSEEYYFHVVDIDRYDIILGTPFFTKHNVVLDFKNIAIWVDCESVLVYNTVDEARSDEVTSGTPPEEHGKQRTNGNTNSGGTSLRRRSGAVSKDHSPAPHRADKVAS